MKLAYFTDLHIGLPGEDTRGVDVRRNLALVIKAVLKESPDVVIIGGDICYREPIAEIYTWVRQQLAPFANSLYITPGNHDDARMLDAAFNFGWLQPSGECFFRKEFGGHTALFLDSSKRSMSDLQYAWLTGQLTQSSGPLLIFMHHPPFLCGVPYMDDNHAFEERGRLQELLFSYQDQIYLFCGHYHVEKTVSMRNVHAVITPSCFFQIDQNQPDFAVDHYHIAYRIIRLEQDMLTSRLHYLQP